MPTLTIPNTFIDGDTIEAAEHNANFSAIATLVNSTGLDADNLADGAVTTAKLASSAVETAKIADLNVTAGKLAADSVTTAKIVDSNVTTAKIADLNVTTAKIADLNVTTAKINDGAVTKAKLATIPAFFGSTSAQTAFTGSYQKIAFTMALDNAASWSTDTYTIPSDGVYTVTSNVPIYTNTVGSNAWVTLFVDSTPVASTYITPPQNGYSLLAAVNYTGALTAGQTISVQFKNSAGAYELTGNRSSVGATATLSIVKTTP
jgi:hypothetical protein